MTQQTIFVATIITAVVFFIRENPFKKSKVKGLTEKDLLKTLSKAMKADMTTFEHNGEIIKQGDRVRFNTEKYGPIQGDFVGIRKSKAKAYKDIFVVSLVDGKAVQVAIDGLFLESLVKY